MLLVLDDTLSYEGLGEGGTVGKRLGFTHVNIDGGSEGLFLPNTVTVS